MDTPNRRCPVCGFDTTEEDSYVVYFGEHVLHPHKDVCYHEFKDWEEKQWDKWTSRGSSPAPSVGK